MQLIAGKKQFYCSTEAGTDNGIYPIKCISLGNEEPKVQSKRIALFPKYWRPCPGAAKNRRKGGSFAALSPQEPPEDKPGGGWARGGEQCQSYNQSLIKELPWDVNTF